MDIMVDIVQNSACASTRGNDAAAARVARQWDLTWMAKTPLDARAAKLHDKVAKNNMRENLFFSRHGQVKQITTAKHAAGEYRRKTKEDERQAKKAKLVG